MGLRKAMEDDPKVLIMGEDVGKLGGVFRITDGLQKDFGEDRVIDSPLAESGIVGTAVGLALRGYRPVVEIQFDGFVFPAYDQIVTQVAKMRYRSKGRSPMPMVIRIPFGGGIGAVEHHSETPEAHFAHTPGLKVVACSNPVDGYWMIQQAIACDDPMIFLEPKRHYHARQGRARRVRHARPLFIPPSRTPRPRCHACSPTGRWSRPPGRPPRPRPLRACSIEVIDLRTLTRWTWPCRRVGAPTGRAVVTHEAQVNLGLGAEVAARIRSSASTPWKRRCCGSAGSTPPTPPPGSRRSTFPTLTGCWMPSTDRWGGDGWLTSCCPT